MGRRKDEMISEKANELVAAYGEAVDILEELGKDGE